MVQFKSSNQMPCHLGLLKHSSVRATPPRVFCAAVSLVPGEMAKIEFHSAESPP